MDLVLTSRFDFVLSEARLTSALLLHEMVLHNRGADPSEPSAHGNDKHVDSLNSFELWVQHHR